MRSQSEDEDTNGGLKEGTNSPVLLELVMNLANGLGAVGERIGGVVRMLGLFGKVPNAAKHTQCSQVPPIPANLRSIGIACHAGQAARGVGLWLNLFTCK
jgi:hypothetical protein